MMLKILEHKKAYLNYKDMLAENDIEIVSICTLADTHYQIIKDCVSYGVKAVFCEKPIANNLNDANEIIKLCKKIKFYWQLIIFEEMTHSL